MFREALERGAFVVTVEMVPGRGPAGPGLDTPAAFARRVRETGLGVHALSLTDNPGGGAAVSPDAIAREVRDAGLDVLVHMACRDMNRNAFEARASALSRDGLHQVLALTGDYPTAPAGTIARPVFDVDAVQAVHFLKRMNEGLAVPGRKPGTTETLAPTRFLVGAAVSPFKMTEEELVGQFLKLDRKIAAGADFIIPQLGYNMRRFLELRRYLGARGHRVPVFGNVYVLSYGVARAMHAGQVPGCVVPDTLLQRLKDESAEADKGKAKRLDRAARMIAVFRGMGFHGVHLGGFGLKFEDVAMLLETAEKMQRDWESMTGDVAFEGDGEWYLFPPPTSWRPDAPPDSDPIPALRGGRGGPAYAFMRGVHDTFFDPGRAGYRACRAWYRAIDGRRALSGANHAAERAVKGVLFGCRDCGDCGLPDTAFRCPESNCPKGQRNGPCGGTRPGGQCEVYEDRPCLWIEVIRRLKAVGRLEDLRGPMLPGRDPALQYTSGWANFYLGRDYQARRPGAPAMSDAGG